MKNPLKDQPRKYGYRFRQKTWYSNYHLGIDYTLKEGSPIYAPVSGTAKHITGSQCGTAVYLIGDDGKCHRLMHMRQRACKNREIVKEGQLIGYVGSTGYSTAPHLHWDVFDGNHIPTGNEINIKNFIDPEQYLKANTKPMTLKQELIETYGLLGDLRREQIVIVDEMGNLKRGFDEMIEKLEENTKAQTALRAKEYDLLNKLT